MVTRYGQCLINRLTTVVSCRTIKMWRLEYPVFLYSLHGNRPNQSLGTYPNVTLTSHVFPSHVEHSHFVVGVVEDFVEPYCSFFSSSLRSLKRTFELWKFEGSQE